MGKMEGIDTSSSIVSPQPSSPSAAMVSSKARSGLSEGSDGKTASAASKVTKVIGWNRSTKPDYGSPSPAQKSSSAMPRLSSLVSKPRSLVERTSKLAESKLPKKNSPSPEDLKQTVQSSELQKKLDAIEDDLKTAREKLASVEQEKIQISVELHEAKRLANEANEKLQEAIFSRENAEKGLATEKLRADKLEHVSAEGAKEREEAHQKELKIIQNQHALDFSALLSVTEELQKFRFELANAIDAKNADDAKKGATFNGEKVDVMSKEVSHLNSMIDSKLDDMNKEAAQMINKLKVEIYALKVELERAKLAEGKLAKMDELVELLQTEVTDARKATSDACKQIGESKEVVASLETKLMEANQSEKSATESLEITMKKMEEQTSLLQDAETEIAALKGKVEYLEIEVAKYKFVINESDGKLDLSQQEAECLGETVEQLRSKVRKLEVEKLQTIDKDKIAASEVERLLEEKNTLIDELKISKDGEQNAKKAMEGLALALDEMSTEVRENQDRLITKQAEIEDARAQIEQLHSALRNTEEKYEVMLIETKYEIVRLKKTLENFETETSNSSTECDTAKKSEVEHELAFLKAEMPKVVDSLKAAEEEVQEAKADRNDMLNKLKQTQSAAASSFEVAEEAKDEMLQLKDRLMDKENELQSITQENDDLRMRETANVQKIKELSASLEEVKIKKTDEKVELSKSEKKYDPHPDVSQDMSTDESVLHYHADEQRPNENKKGIESGEEDPSDIMSRALSSEKDQGDDSGDGTELKTDSIEKTDRMTESTDQGVSSPVRNHHQKKRPLLHKVGNLLKMGNHKSHK